MFFPLAQSKPTSWQGQITIFPSIRPPESRHPAWLHQSSSARYSPSIFATTTLRLPMAKPRISPSRKFAGPSLIRMRSRASLDENGRPFGRQEPQHLVARWRYRPENVVGVVAVQLLRREVLRRVDANQ